MNTNTNVHDIDPSTLGVVINQYGHPGPFGTLEVHVSGYSVTLFAMGDVAAETLRHALQDALQDAVTVTR